MKNLLITLGVALAACAAAFGAFYALSDVPAMHRAAQDGDAMMWLRTEFHLDEAQFAAIKKLHEDYAVVCAGHCTEIAQAKKRNAPPAEMAALEKTCVDAMTEHFRRVAQLMPAGEGERYLAMVLPRIAGYAHTGAPNVRLTTP
ncbi:MAG TPA: hypothetical protein VHD62_04665 [Opitutaceae bacterium]|nr:hypothetical protein [Opitutaceae bacterium]